VVGWRASGHLLIGRKQTCSIGNFKGWYFSFHAETNMSSAHLNVSGGSDGEWSEVEGGEWSEVKGEPSAKVGETGLGGCCLACFLEGCSSFEQSS
jgi:hypothetical protein